PWTAFGAVEDAEYATRLRQAGVRVRYGVGAHVSTSAPASVAGLCRQRRRWRGAGLASSKPLALGCVLGAVGLGFAGGLVWWPLALVASHALLYLRAVWVVGVTPKRLGLLIRSPEVVLRLGWLAVAGLARRPAGWDGTRNRTPARGPRP
ncbi:MAG: hypothetical protein K2V38_17015, partial [Gemmataceae bacterium]|nr:hypothetical protein [Gemmataceae bacterium]